MKRYFLDTLEMEMVPRADGEWVSYGTHCAITKELHYRIKDAEASLRDERRIVERVWSALGISTYEQAGGKEISEIVADWKARAEKAGEELERLYQDMAGESI